MTRKSDTSTELPHGGKHRPWVALAALAIIAGVVVALVLVGHVGAAVLIAAGGLIVRSLRAFTAGL